MAMAESLQVWNRWPVLLRVLAAGGLAIAHQLLLKHLLGKRKRFGGLQNIVGYSAKVIAAARALESERGGDALVHDPLAAVLAGKQALAHARRSATATITANSASHRISRLIMRTLFCDDVVVVATSGARQRCASLRALAQHTGSGCTQVVLLGAGMDTRAWRLDLPADAVRWFEIDQPDVLAAKAAQLKRAGATFQPAINKRKRRFPLHAASYAAVPADLEVPGWSAALVAAGFKTQAPTLWVLEGLLYYLDQDAVPRLLQEMADVSGSGSAMVASAVSRAATDAWRGASKSSIMSAWKWGVPGPRDEWPAYFKASGWTTVGIDGWQELAREYGLEPASPARASNPGTDNASAASAIPERDRFGLVVAVRP